MSYGIGDYRFDVEGFFPRWLFDRIIEIRVNDPGVVLREARARQRRERPGGADGKLMILAANHPARGVTAAAGHALVMGDRHSYLGRILRVLADPLCDGVLGTPDILEDLLIVDHLVKREGGPGLLDGRLLVGSMNRGGVAGTAFEMADAFTAYAVQNLVRFRLDAGMVMFRLDPDDPNSGRTIAWCSQAVTDCFRCELPIFVEALPVKRIHGAYQVQRTAEHLIRTVGIASGLGESSLGTWIKIPYCEEYARVARATSCPILMLGGESKGDPSPLLYDFAAGMAAGANVRGTLVGRNVHHPGADDPFAVSAAVSAIVHHGASGDDAVGRLMESRGVSSDALTRYFE